MLLVFILCFNTGTYAHSSADNSDEYVQYAPFEEYVIIEDEQIPEGYISINRNYSTEGLFSLLIAMAGVCTGYFILKNEKKNP